MIDSPSPFTPFAVRVISKAPVFVIEEFTSIYPSELFAVKVILASPADIGASIIKGEDVEILTSPLLVFIPEYVPIVPILSPPAVSVR